MQIEMKNLIFCLIFLYLVISPLVSLEEQNYQVRVLVDESRKEALIFPLPHVSYDMKNLKEDYLDRKILSYLIYTEPVVDLCGIIPLKEDDNNA